MNTNFATLKYILLEQNETMKNSGEKNNLDAFSMLYYNQGIHVFKGDLAEKYLQRRILPSDRQALSQYLEDMNLKEYDLIDILDYTKGYCEMDRNYFREVKYDGFVWR